MSQITDEITKWAEYRRDLGAIHSAEVLEARLRTADAIIERVADVSCACDLIGCEHDEARAYLAAREKER